MSTIQLARTNDSQRENKLKTKRETMQATNGSAVNKSPFLMELFILAVDRPCYQQYDHTLILQVLAAR